MNFVFIFFIALLPSLIWLAFYLKEDRHPEPKKFIIYVFLAGAAVTIPVIGLELLFNEIASFFKVEENGLVNFLGLAVIEEAFKFLAAYLAVRKSLFFDEPIDAMVYVITAAMGFAAVENVLAVLDASGIAASNPVWRETRLWTGVAEAASLRFIGATLLHALTSGITGYFWAKGIIKRRVFRSILSGLLAASLVHAVFNRLVSVNGKENYLIPLLFLIIVAFFVLADFEKLKKYDTIKAA